MAAYCPQCGTKLEEQFIFGRTRAVCPGCSYVHFEDPKVAVGVVVEKEGRIVLAKRGHEPNYGLWSFPSGFADAGEVLEDAARREVEEETGLSVRIDRLLGVYSTTGERVVFVAYAGSVIGEMSSYTADHRRTATVIANESSVLYFLSADKISRFDKESAQLASSIHELVARTLGMRITYMNRRLIQELR